MYVRPLVVNSPSLKELKILKRRVKSGRVGQCAAGIRYQQNLFDTDCRCLRKNVTIETKGILTMLLLRLSS